MEITITCSHDEINHEKFLEDFHCARPVKFLIFGRDVNFLIVDYSVSSPILSNARYEIKMVSIDYGDSL